MAELPQRLERLLRSIACGAQAVGAEADPRQERHEREMFVDGGVAGVLSLAENNLVQPHSHHRVDWPISFIAGVRGRMKPHETTARKRNESISTGLGKASTTGSAGAHTAASPFSPVRMRITLSSEETKIFPSPISPVRAARVIASTTADTAMSDTTTSTFTFGTRSTVYSVPRYCSLWPFWRPNPRTSLTVRPCTPTWLSAVLTSSSLKGLKMASIFFTFRLLRFAAPD